MKKSKVKSQKAKSVGVFGCATIQSVNVLDFKNDRKANQLAQKLLTQAKENEPNITQDLKTIAKLTNAKVVGLENKLKSEESLTRKLSDLSEKFNIPIDKIAKRNNDALRYTFIFETENCGAGFAETIVRLKKKGYEISKTWNAWRNEGREEDSGYRGLNVTLKSSQKQKFELQFHTAESFRLKTETHALYEEFRNPQTSDARKIEISKYVVELAGKITRPQGI